MLERTTMSSWTSVEISLKREVEKYTQREKNVWYASYTIAVSFYGHFTIFDEKRRFFYEPVCRLCGNLYRADFL